eukprot:gene25130-30667_t
MPAASPLVVFALVVLVAAVARVGFAANMNGRYKVASGADQNVPFNDDYASKGHEYFDVWAPEIATHYGEVFWTDQHNQPLPESIVKRFAGKAIAITGYEMDQVMVQPTGQPGVNPGLDVSVPINWAYNHHYMAYMTGEHSALVHMIAEPGDTEAHGAAMKWVALDKPSAAFRADSRIPTSQFFSEGNGGESRKSFHGYPEGFAQLIDSPQTWHITPMQIDTRNRDCGVTPADIKNCTKFTPGPEPKQARYGLGIPLEGTNYSGILECPCNSRYGGDPAFYPEAGTKTTEHKFLAQGAAKCPAGEAVAAASQCFAAAAELGFTNRTAVNKTVTDTNSVPSGCSVVRRGDGTMAAYFNTELDSAATCSTTGRRAGRVFAGELGVTLGLAVDPDAGKVTFKHSAKGIYCSQNHVAVLGKWEMANASAAEATRALQQCE